MGVALLLAAAVAFPIQQAEADRIEIDNVLRLLSGIEFKQDRTALIAAAPGAVDKFRRIIDSPETGSLQLSRLYSVITDAKVDRKRFLKPALRDLNYADATVRRVAATFVGNVGGGPEFAAPLFMLMLHDSDADVTNAARRALGQVGDAATMVALEHLIRFGTGKPETPKRVKELTAAFTATRDEIKARLAAAAKVAPAQPK